jgi:sugar O-acyltransferase (sialic acid O-acetyltransferase NeuD family)
MINNVFFWGAKYKAGIIYDLITNGKITANTKNLYIKYLFDPNLKKAMFSSEAMFSNDEKNLNKFLDDSDYFVTCIGSEFGKARYLISKELEKKNLKPLDVISKHAYFDKKDLLGKGVQLFPGSVVHYRAKVGDYSILNTGSILEHDCTVGNGVHMMPGSVVGGNTRIGDFVTIGLNATVMPQIEIEEGAFIGAGAVVTKNVKKNEVVAGNPAKFLKNIEHKLDLKIFKKL